MAFQEFTGKEYLMIDIANSMGLDKKSWNERLAWFQKNESNLLGLLNQAKEPALFHSGVMAWQDHLNKIPSGYPISLDATSSGIQLLACLTGDRKAATLCNVVDTGERENAYQKLYQIIKERAGAQMTIDADDTKAAIMTAFYSSKAVPKRVFGEGEYLDIFYSVLQEECPGAWELNETMLSIWDNTREVYEWVMPDNFHVYIPVLAQETETVHFLGKPVEVTYTVRKPIEGGRSLGANLTHSLDSLVVREISARCMYDPNQIKRIRAMAACTKVGTRLKTESDKLVVTLWNHFIDSGFLSARILSHLDFANAGHVDMEIILNLVDSLPNKPFEVLTVHDCYRCLPRYGNDIRRQYNRLLSEIARSDLLSFLLSQILKRRVQIGKLDYDLWKDIPEANYALS